MHAVKRHCKYFISNMHNHQATIEWSLPIYACKSNELIAQQLLSTWDVNRLPTLLLIYLFSDNHVSTSILIYISQIYTWCSSLTSSDDSTTAAYWYSSCSSDNVTKRTYKKWLQPTYSWITSKTTVILSCQFASSSERGKIQLPNKQIMWKNKQPVDFQVSWNTWRH